MFGRFIALQHAIDSVNQGLLAPLYQTRLFHAVSLMTAPWLLPLDIAIELGRRYSTTHLPVVRLRIESLTCLYGNVVYVEVTREWCVLCKDCWTGCRTCPVTCSGSSRRCFTSLQTSISSYRPVGNTTPLGMWVKVEVSLILTIWSELGLGLQFGLD